jgi:hypothetical protein
MKFTVVCLVSSVNSSPLSEDAAVTKEVVVANPRATVQNLRATVAIQFRLNVVAFDFCFRHRPQEEREKEERAEGAPTSSPTGSGAPTVDFSDEKKLLTECGLQDGDHLSVVPKNYRPPADGVGAAAAAAVGGGGALTTSVVDDSRAAKKPRTEGGDAAALMGEDEEDSVGDEEDEEEDSDADEGGASAQRDLFEALHDVVPDLTVLRQEFLADPQGVMERVERNHPSLFQAITQNQETFVNLMNSEQLTTAAQSMLHGGSAFDGTDSADEEQSIEWGMGEEDEEMDEETSEQMRELFQNYIAARQADGDFDEDDLAALEESGMQVGDVDDDDEDDGAEGTSRATGGGKKSEKAFILARVPSEEDEKKIQALTELGFSYEQCKLAFYMCHRSIDRASNMLFEAPPEL